MSSDNVVNASEDTNNNNTMYNVWIITVDTKCKRKEGISDSVIVDFYHILKLEEYYLFRSQNYLQELFTFPSIKYKKEGPCFKEIFCLGK